MVREAGEQTKSWSLIRAVFKSQPSRDVLTFCFLNLWQQLHIKTADYVRQEVKYPANTIPGYFRNTWDNQIYTASCPFTSIEWKHCSYFLLAIDVIQICLNPYTFFGIQRYHRNIGTIIPILDTSESIQPIIKLGTIYAWKEPREPVVRLTVWIQPFKSVTMKLGMITVSWFVTHLQDALSIHWTKIFAAGLIILSGLFLRRREIAGICLNSKGPGAIWLLMSNIYCFCLIVSDYS